MMRCGLCWLCVLVGLWGQGGVLPQGPHHAVVIGLNHYEDQSLMPLVYPEDDARDVAATLTGSGWNVTSVLPSVQQQPSSSRAMLDVIREAASRCPTSGTLLVYFAGHGGKAADRSYLFAYETRRDSLPTTGVAVSEVQAILRSGGRLHSALIVDACRNPVGGPRDGRSSPEAARWDDLTLSSGHVAYFGTSDGQTSEEPPADVKIDGNEVRHGYFTHLLLQGMASVSADANGDGFVGIQELYRWVTVRMRALLEKKITQQVPVMQMHEGTGDLILVRAPRDETAPKVEITKPANKTSVVAGLVTFEGTVTDDGVVDQVILRFTGGKEISLRPDGSTWTTTERLEPGVEEFSVVAVDKAKNWSEPVVRKVVVHALVNDPTGVSGNPEDANTAVQGDSTPSPAAKGFEGLTHARINKQGFNEYTLDKDPTVVLIRIPGGTFTMGSNEAEADDDEKNLTRVTLSPYFLAKHETTQAQFGRFCDATRRALPDAPSWGRQADHPVVNVRYEDAQAYCAWAGLTLPTEAQWEFAARGTEGRKWPWGSTSPASDRTLANSETRGDGFEHTAPVGSFPRGVGPFGTLDQAGNVWEWCADWYSSAYPGGSVTNPTGPTKSDDGRVFRGGSWNYSARNLRGANRYGYEPSLRYNFLGFRSALVAP